MECAHCHLDYIVALSILGACVLMGVGVVLALWMDYRRGKG